MLYLRSNFRLLCKSLVLITMKSQATLPANSLRLCDPRRLTSVFVVLLEMALYSFIAARGIGVKSASARVFKKNFYFEDVTENKGF